MTKKIWITWENHRRSKELALEFCAIYYPLVYDAKRPIRYVVLSVKTVLLLVKMKPELVFCQNPSIVLTAILTLLKPVFGYKLVVDRHSNFKIEFKDSSSLKWKVFHLLSRWTIKNSDLTIVTNDHLKRICNDVGGRAEILQDKIPQFVEGVSRDLPEFIVKPEKTQVMFVTMFDPDEPINEIISAGMAIKNCVFYLTGNYRKYYSNSEAAKLLDFNVILTGFVSDKNYLSLMGNCDLVVVLTKKDFILNCGAYEAISLEKPLILSDTPTLRSYFRDAAIYSECSSSSIKSNIMSAIDNLEHMKKNLMNQKADLRFAWSKRFTVLSGVIDKL